MKYICAVD